MYILYEGKPNNLLDVLILTQMISPIISMGYSVRNDVRDLEFNFRNYNKLIDSVERTIRTLRGTWVEYP